MRCRVGVLGLSRVTRASQQSILLILQQPASIQFRRTCEKSSNTFFERKGGAIAGKQKELGQVLDLDSNGRRRRGATLDNEYRSDDG